MEPWFVRGMPGVKNDVKAAVVPNAAHAFQPIVYPTQPFSAHLSEMISQPP